VINNINTIPGINNMNIREFGKPVTSKSLNESLAARFGQRINLEKFTLEQLQDARNKLRTKLSQVETMESFNKVQNETYQKSKLMLDVLNAAISERGDIDEESIEESMVTEGAEDQAELVMAAKEMVEKVTGWMEDTAEMQTESMLNLADAIRDEMGQEAADTFTNTVKPALDSLYGALEATRTALTGGVGQLTGEAEPVDTIGADDDMTDMEPTTDMDGADMTDMGADDDFAASEPATGGDEEADRAKRESKDYSAKKAAAGKKYSSKADGKKVAGAVLKRLRAKESIDGSRLITALSKKK
jgi:hypothetical protein